MIYAACELGMLLFTWIEWNANTVAVRSATAALIGYYLLKKKPLQLGMLLIGLAVAFVFRSRTVIVGTTFAVLLMWIVNRAPKNKEIIFFGLLASFILLFTFAGQIRSTALKVASNSLGSSNPVSQFFLEDKNARDLEYDYLDRSHIWVESIASLSLIHI